MKSESSFKKKVAAFLKTLNLQWSLKTQERSRHGTPDFIGCLGKNFFALELKRSVKEIVPPLQLYTIEQIARTGSYARVAYPENWEEIKKELTELSKS